MRSNETGILPVWAISNNASVSGESRFVPVSAMLQRPGIHTTLSTANVSNSKRITFTSGRILLSTLLRCVDKLVYRSFESVTTCSGTLRLSSFDTISFNTFPSSKAPPTANIYAAPTDLTGRLDLWDCQVSG